jgi:hypothetical protein
MNFYLIPLYLMTLTIFGENYKLRKSYRVISYMLFFFLLSGVGLSPLGIATTSGLLYKPQMIDEGDCGAIGGMKINLPQRHFVHHKSHMTRPGLEPGPRRREASD